MSGRVFGKGRERPDGRSLVGVFEIAERLGVKVNTVQVWRRRHGSFPPPLVELAAGPVWWWPDVEVWTLMRSGGASEGVDGAGDAEADPSDDDADREG